MYGKKHSEEAKEKAKQWYLDGQEPFIFSEMVKEDLYNLFGRNNLDVQYSLASCQGDGFNIYGKINARSIFNCLENHNGGAEFKAFEDVLTENEKKIILAYAEDCGEVKLPMNNRYCYSLADYIDIVEDWTWELENADYTDINEEALKNLQIMELQNKNTAQIAATLARQDARAARTQSNETDFLRNEIDSKNQWSKEDTAILGKGTAIGAGTGAVVAGGVALSGALAGTKLGAMFGTFAGPIGTAIGAVAGAAIGAIIGGIFGAANKKEASKNE